MLTGRLALPNKKVWASFEYEDGSLTVYGGKLQEFDDTEYLPSFETNKSIKYLVGKLRNSKKMVIFIVDSIPFEDTFGADVIHFHSATISVGVNAYFIMESLEHGFAGLTMHCDELDYFYSSQNSLTYNYEGNKGYTLIIKTRTETEKHFSFFVDKVKIDGLLYIDGIASFHSTTPLSFGTKLSFSFPETYSLDFIFKLYYIVTKFFYLIARRTNIYFDSIRLIQKYNHPNEGTERIKYVDFYHLGQELANEEVKVLEKTLPYEYISSHLSELFEFIADDNLYVHHIAESSKSSFTIARMVLITAGFEWNANKFLKPPVSSQRIHVKEQIINYLQESIKVCSSKQRRYFNSFVDLVERHDVSLSNKIESCLKRYDTILFSFIKFLYGLNQIDLSEDYKESIGKRIQSHRNAFAHGDISKEIDYDVVLDYIVLEWVIYCIILEQAGFDYLEIKKIIHYIRDGNIHQAASIINHYDNEE